MSTDLDLVPDWAKAVPNAPVNDPPAQVGGGWQAPMPWQQLLATVEFFLTSIIGQIAIALGGIEIFGWKPLEFLAEWGQGLIDQASNAYIAATSAQATANTAQTNANNALTYIASFVDGVLGTGHLITDVATFVNSAAANASSAVANLAALISSLLSNPAAVLGALPQALISGLSGALSVLTNGIGGAVAFIQGVIDALIGALRGLPIIGGFIPALSTAVTATQVQQQNFTITAIATGYKNPAWVSPYPVADVTYPISQNVNLIPSGSTGPASAGTAHTHTMSTTGRAGPGSFGVNPGESSGGYVSISNTTVMDTAALYGKKTAASIDNIWLEVLRENSDLSLTRISSTDISSLLTTTDTYIEAPITPIIAQAGERYVVRVRNASTVATTVGVIGVARVTGVSPDIGFETLTTPVSAQTSYTAAEAATARAGTAVTMWMMLAAKNLDEPDVSFSDDFNRANMGPWWYTSGTGAIVIGGSEANYGGFSAGDQSALYIRRTSGDASRVDGNLYINSAATSQRLGLILHGNRDLSEFMYLSVTGSDAKIYSYAAGTLTQRATVATGGTDIYTLYYDVGADKYVALKGGNTFNLEWLSVGGAVTHDSDHRFGGMRISCASSTPAGTIDNWTLRDWAPGPTLTVSPSGGSLTLTGSAPIARIGTGIFPGGASLTLTGATPTVRVGESLQPTGAVLTLTGSAPNVPLGTGVIPGGATLTLTGAAPVVLTPSVVTPSGASLTITGSAPVVQIGIYVTPSGATLTLTGSAPTVLTPRLVTPTGAALTVTGSSPVVLTPRLVVPTGATMTITGSAPVVTLAVATPKVLTKLYNQAVVRSSTR